MNIKGILIIGVMALVAGFISGFGLGKINIRQKPKSPVLHHFLWRNDQRFV